MNMPIEPLNILVADVEELRQKSNHDFASNFFDGQSDAENNFEPVTYQWFDSDYRKGYLLGMAKRIGIEWASKPKKLFLYITRISRATRKKNKNKFLAQTNLKYQLIFGNFDFKYFALESSSFSANADLY